ncbi:MAG: hypothetical protein OT477_00610 [Chloroflexi bacterium]|nr:hypothetical protein [Chloroflexota bacterium]
MSSISAEFMPSPTTRVGNNVSSGKWLRQLLIKSKNTPPWGSKSA